MSIEEVLDRLEKAERAATAGPWTLEREVAAISGEAVRGVDGYRPRWTYYVTRVRELGFVGTAFHGETPHNTDPDHVPPDADLIALSRNALPALLRVVRAAMDYRRASAGPDEDATEKTTGAAFDGAVAALEGAAK